MSDPAGQPVEPELHGVAVSGPAGKPEPTDPEDIKRDIERTRAELSETVEALAHKVNVPAQVKEKVHETSETVAAKAQDVTVKVNEATNRALVKLPPPARLKAERVLTTVRARPLPVLLGSAGALVLLGLVLRHRR